MKKVTKRTEAIIGWLTKNNGEVHVMEKKEPYHTISVTVSVPKAYMPLVIGKNGVMVTTIRDLAQDVSDAALRVTVSEPEDTDTDTEFRREGDLEDIKLLMEEFSTDVDITVTKVAEVYYSDVMAKKGGSEGIREDVERLVVSGLMLRGAKQVIVEGGA